MFGFFAKLFGSKTDKDIKKITPYVELINEEFIKLKGLTNDELRNETVKQKEYYIENTKVERENYNTARMNLIKNNSIDKVQINEMQLKIKKEKKKLKEKSDKVLMEMLPKVFAIVKETARRFSENDSIEVNANLFDRSLISEDRDYVRISGDKAIWSTSWDVMKNLKKWDMVHFDVQLIGGIVLHQGKIAEMATGEGKTLVSTLPIFLNALTGNGVHLVTVNDYLAKRDFYWNRPIFEFHGLSVGCIELTDPGSYERRKAYQCDITYGTNNEFGFDYLRDNMASRKEDCVQRDHSYAIVDEVDSVLIDDARTPLIISGEYDNGDVKVYEKLQPVVKKLFETQVNAVNKFLLKAKDGFLKGEKTEEIGLALVRAYRGYPKYKPLIKFMSEPGVKLFKEKSENIYLENNSQRMPEVDEELYFYIDERYNNVELTDKGFDFLSGQLADDEFFLLPDISIDINNIDLSTDLGEKEKTEKKNKIFRDYILKTNRIHVVQNLLRAYCLFEKNVDYVVLNGMVLIVDEQTGRILHGRRYSDGLHQALEAKELVKIAKSSKTYATITLQNYFRLYDKLAGMTGTASTESVEFYDIYKLDVVSIPTNKKVIRDDKNDLVYKTKKIKFAAVVDKVVELSNLGRPVLVGTTSVDTSEMLSRMLTLKKIKHQVLNAKYHEKEAEIIAHAGESGTVTIATNMAGRGTDIKLDKKALEAGGLAIIGTERHESRRVDQQLRGRAGRQGDPGSSQFYVSFEDDLMRMSLGERRTQMFIDGLNDDDVIEGGLITSSIARAQKKVEENNFGYRKRILEYDDVLNKQREKEYERRRVALRNEIINSDVYNIIWGVVKNYILLDGEESTYEDVCRRYKGIIGNEYFEDRDSFMDKLYSELLDIIYKDFINKYLDKCTYIDSKIFFVVSNKNIKYKFSVSDDEHRVNVIADFENNSFENNKDRAEYLMRLVISNVSIFFIDMYWQKHLQVMDDLKKSVQNASYEQTDPLVVFKFEAFDIFVKLVTSINCDIIKFVLQCDFDGVEEENDDIGIINDILSKVVEGDSLKDLKKKLKVLTN